MSLLKVYNALAEIKALSKTNDKKAALKRHLDKIGRPLYMTLKYAVEPALKFNCKDLVYTPNIKAPEDSIEIFDYLDMLSKKRGITKKEKKVLTALASYDKQTVEVVNRILNKNLECGVAIGTVRELISNITDPSMMLCGYNVEIIKKYNYLSNPLKMFVRRCGGWANVVGHVRLDGMRIKYSRNQYFTRSRLDNQFYAFLENDIKLFCQKVREELRYTNDEIPIDLDGEIMYYGDLNSTATDYSSILDIDKNKLVYHIFDIPNIRFKQKERLRIIESIGEIGQVKPIASFKFNNEQEFLDKFYELRNQGQEGLVLKNVNCFYDGNKSNDWCEVKEFDTLDLEVYSVVEGKGSFRGMVGTFRCWYNGQIVDVGKGACTVEEAKHFLHNPPGMIEVKFQDITPEGKLRFGTYYRNRDGDKNET